MPFKSEKQKAFMFSQHPDIAQKWVDEGKAGIEKAATGELLRDYEPPEDHEINPDLNSLVPNGDLPIGEALTVAELGELLVSTGELTVEEAEELLGADIDGDDEEWESDEHLMKVGVNPRGRQAERQLGYLAQTRMLAFLDPPEPDGPLTALTKAMLSGESTEDVVKAFTKTPHFGKKHLTAGGNWKYDYPKTTAGGESGNPTSKRSTARPGRKSTGSAVQVRTAGGKNYAVLRHTKGDARKLNKLREKGKVDVKDKAKEH